MAQQPFVGQGRLVIETSRSHSVGFLWTSDQPTEKPQRENTQRIKYPCPWRNSNQQSQQARGRIRIPQAMHTLGSLKSSYLFDNS